MKKEGINLQNKRGQVTLFIIIALIIVAAAVVFLIFYPNIKTTLGGTTDEPSSFMQDCLEKSLKEKIDLVSKQGGTLRPTNFYLYQDDKIEYLCYINEFYKQCVMQKPLLTESISQEVSEAMQGDIKKCWASLENNYKKQGYEVAVSEGEASVELIPKRVVISFTNVLTLKKDTAVRYGGEGNRPIRVVLNNNIYELASIAKSVLNQEAKYGDTEIMNYMFFYRDLKVEKYKQTDGTKIFILTDRNTGNKFQFATRSVVFPAGYGISEI